MSKSKSKSKKVQLSEKNLRKITNFSSFVARITRMGIGFNHDWLKEVE